MRPKYLAIVLVLLALAVPAFPAQAGGVVSVCDEGHLLAALSGGGTVTFTCSGTINLASTITISANTTIDGSGRAVTISGNYAVRVFHVNSGISLTLKGLNIINGRAKNWSGGGGIRNHGTLNVYNSTFTGDQSDDWGGAISNESDGTLNVSQTTFSGNTGNGNGGAIENFGTATVSNSTFYNSYSTMGGAIDNQNGTLTVVNSTFSGNRGLIGATISTYGPVPVLLKNTIVANSIADEGCYGPINDGGGNLGYPDTSCPGIHLNPLLGPLQNNGGPTQTMALGAGSAAIDAANDATCAAPPVNNRDQRGAIRPSGAHCDIGAVEQGAPALPRPISVAIDIKPGSDPNSVNCRNPNGVIAVAVLTTDTFDATTVDHTTVIFEGAVETHVDHKTGEPTRHEEDVDGDGDTDLVFHFRLGSPGLTCESTEAALWGETFAGLPILGTDSVRMVGGG